jgi:hypothetical protein
VEDDGVGAEGAFVDVEFEVDAEEELGEDGEEEDVGEGAVDRGGELAAAVAVAEEVAGCGEDEACCL